MGLALSWAAGGPLEGLWFLIHKAQGRGAGWPGVAPRVSWQKHPHGGQCVLRAREWTASLASLLQGCGTGGPGAVAMESGAHPFSRCGLGQVGHSAVPRKAGVPPVLTCLEREVVFPVLTDPQEGPALRAHSDPPALRP